MREIMIPMNDGKKIYARYYDNNKKDTLLYLHGGPGTGCYTFQYCAYKLSKFVNVVLIDERGVLRSDKIEKDDECTVNMLVEDCETIRKYLNINNFIVAGHSFGGYIALQYANKYPNSVEKIIFENPSFYFIESIKSIQKKMIKFLLRDGFNAFADSLDFDVKNDDDVRIFIDNLSEIPEEIRNEVYHLKEYSHYSEEEKKFLKVKVDSNERYQYSSIHFEKIMQDSNVYKNIFGLISKIECKSLLISGEFDPVFDKHAIKKYKEKSDDGKVYIVKNCGHFVHIDDCNTYVKIVHNFIT